MAVDNLVPVYLNLGCGLNKADPPWVNVDAFVSCNPDIVWDLEKIPFPWKDNSIDGICAIHVFEHLREWWPAFCECARILKPGGWLVIRVPDPSSDTTVTYRDHHHTIGLVSFIGAIGWAQGTNAWAEEIKDSVPFKLVDYARVPFKQYYWMIKWCPWLLRFLADHCRNFIHEQMFEFVKIKVTTDD